MVRMYNLVDIFDRELEILDVNDKTMIYALDQKSDSGNLCALGEYDFDSGEKKTLMVLEGTRLYESFRTYGAVKDYFYAVTVEDDYRLRLQEINVHDWEIRRTFRLVPEGEVLNIYPVHPDYLIVTDEVAATDEILMKFNDEDYAGRYYTLSYLYSLKTGEKWYLQDIFYHMDVMDVQTVMMDDGSSQIIFMLQCLNQRGERENKLWAVSLYHLMASLMEGIKPSFKQIEESDHGITMTRIQIPQKDYCYRLVDDVSGRIEICELKAEEGILRKKVLTCIQCPEDGEIIYGPEGQEVYQVKTEADGKLCVTDLSNPEKNFTFDSEYGDFTGIYMDDLAVTAFYQPRMLKEDMVFKECVAVHHTDSKNVEVYDGMIQKKGRKLLMLKSFLFL